MALRLLVEGLDWGMTEAKLAEVFGAFGDLSEARIARDWETGRSRGFGWVTFVATTDGESACAALDGQKLAGRLLRVMVAPEQTPRPAYRSADYGYTNTPPAERLGLGAEAGRYRSADFSAERGPRADRRLYRSADFGYVDGKAAPAGPDDRRAPHPVRPAAPDGQEAEASASSAPPRHGEASGSGPARSGGPAPATEASRRQDPFG